jgi:C4-dicarboxylate transporter DctM subunit
MSLMLLSAGYLLSWMLTIAQIPQAMVNLLGEIAPVIFLMLVNIIFLIAGMFIDGNSALVILVPLVYPISKNLGIDPIHLGIVIVYNISIGMITPPFGMNIFFGMAKFKVSYGKAILALIPFIVISLAVLILITYVPQISLFFPNMFFK